MLDVRRMRVLREVAARGSFSAAAETLAYTQSAISQHVAALEREVGAQLVERGPRGIRLTDAGAALVAHADAIIARLDAAEEALDAIAGLRGGRLRLASFQSGNATLVPRAVAEFRARHPEVEQRLVEAEPEDAVELLRERDVDLALTYDLASCPPPKDDGFTRTHLIDDPYDVILPSGHRLARRASVRLGDLAGEPWILARPACGCNRLVRRACEDVGFAPRAAFETDENTSAQAFVAAGVGVCLLPRLALAALHPDVVARPVHPKPPRRRIDATKLAEGYCSPAVEAMVEILAEIAVEFVVATPALAAAS
jgi:molybdate transport repressor ModE-like protein